MPLDAARAWSAGLAPTTEFMPKTKPATRATALRANPPNFACRRVCCMAASFPDVEDQSSVNSGNTTTQGRWNVAGYLSANFLRNWHTGFALRGSKLGHGS